MVQSEEEWLVRQQRAKTLKSAKDANEAGGRMGEVWTVRTLERNWVRFMGLIEPYE